MFKKFISTSIVIFISTVLFAQEVDYSSLDVIDYRKPKSYIIKDIDVKGIKYLDERILINLSGLGIGQKIEVPGDVITKALEKLWGQGLFSDVKITAGEISRDSISLNIILKERSRLSEFNIHGLKKSQVEDVKEKLNIKRGKQVTENLFNSSERIIKEYLKDKKFLNADVDIVMKDDTTSKANNVFLDIYVTKNNKVKIKDIEFKGNEVIPEWRLLRAMKETGKVNLNIFKSSKFIQDKYEEDKKNIISKYYEKGYRNAKIVMDSVYEISNKRIGIYIEIEEGEQFFFRDIKWVGNTKYMSHHLSNLLKIKKGDPYNPELLNERLNIDEDAVSSLYMDYGYMFSSLTPVIQEVDSDSIDLQIRVREGERVTIKDVIIKGNDRTNEHVIRREMKTRPGDLFSKSDIMRTQRELAQLGYFDPEQMGIEPINMNQSENTVDLEYTLVEKSTDQLEVSGGWGNNMFVGTLGLRFSNFSLRNTLKRNAWKPIPSGDGQTLSVRATTNGKYYSSYSLSFMEPWLGGKKATSLSVSVYHSIQKKATNYFTFDVGSEYMKVTGGSVGVGQRLKWPDDYFTVMNSISFQRYDLKDWDYFIFQNGSSNNLSLNTTFARSSIDAPIYPRRGSSFSLSLQLTFPYSLFKKDKFWELSSNEISRLDSVYIYSDPIRWENLMAKSEADQKSALLYNRENEINSKKFNWVEYHKWKYKGAWYLKIWKDLVLAVNSEFGYLGYYNKELGYSPFGKFNLGGDGMSGYSMYGVETIALRGYTNNSLTPIDENGARAGNIYEKINFELRYPISLKPQATIFVLGFVEAGNAWADMDDYNPFKIKRSAGVGLRAFLPMFGLLGVDWGYGFDNIPGNPDSGGSQFHFVIGQQF